MWRKNIVRLKKKGRTAGSLWMTIMRSRRFLFFLAAGVIIVMFIRYSTNYSNSNNSHNDSGKKNVKKSSSRHRNQNGKISPAGDSKSGGSWLNKFGLFGKSSSSVNEDPFSEDSAPSDCSFQHKLAKVDYQVYDVWEKITERRTGDQLWYELKASRNKPGDEKLLVYVMPHSHADPGWLKTYTEYSVDTNNALTYMLEYLPTHPNMTFTWTEIAFFKLWWNKLNLKQRKTVKGLIKEGRFELTSGSWTMTDEASPYFWASIDNIVEGHQFLQRELGLIPKVEWSNDPFGYGPSVPYLFSKTGMKHLAINRVHVSTKIYLERRQASVFKWRQYWDEQGDHDMLTHVLPFMHYDVPNSCGPEPDICCQFDFKRLTHFHCQGPKPTPISEANVEQKAEMLYEQYKKTASMFRHNVVLILLGDDFRFIDRQEWSQQHDNYQKLFKYMNEREDWNINAQFGTFSQYFAAIESRAQKHHRPFPSVSGDFFPYNDFADHYWTGYFTSRPFYKRMDRRLQAQIRAADLLSALAEAKSSTINADLSNQINKKLESARRQLALFQHHDAITGTSKWHVVTDYGIRMWEAINDATDVIALAAQLILSPKPLVPKSKHLKDSLNLIAIQESGSGTDPKMNLRTANETSAARNVSQDESNKTTIRFTAFPDFRMNCNRSTIQITLFNPLAHSTSQPIRLHSNLPYISVRMTADKEDAANNGENNKEEADGSHRYIQAQVNPVIAYAGGIRNDLFEIVFMADLLPLSLSSYTLTAHQLCPLSTTIAAVAMTPLYAKIIPEIFQTTQLEQGVKPSMATTKLQTEHNEHTGMLEAVTSKDYGRKQMSLQMFHYTDTRSGAYLFMPSRPAEPWPTNGTTRIFVQGPVMSQSHTFLTRIYSTVSIYESPSIVGNEVHVGNTVDLTGVTNSEIVMRLYSDVSTDQHFYTDAVGFQMLHRHYHIQQPIETNYYPMPSTAILQNDKFRLSVLSGQPHGVTSGEDGMLEIMLDRICVTDDFKGLGSDSLLRDNLPTHSDFRIILEPRTTDEGLTNDNPAVPPVQPPERPPEAMPGHPRTTESMPPTAPSHHGHAESDNKLPYVLYHSPWSHHVLQSLLYRPIVLNQMIPAEKMHSEFDSWSSSFQPLPSSFPCDLSLLTIRPLPLPKKERLMIIHKVPTDCSLSILPSQCHSSKKSALKQLMELLGVDNLYETNLSGTKTIKKSITPRELDPDHFSYQDIRTYRIRIRRNNNNNNNNNNGSS